MPQGGRKAKRSGAGTSDAAWALGKAFPSGLRFLASWVSVRTGAGEREWADTSGCWVLGGVLHLSVQWGALITALTLGHSLERQTGARPPVAHREGEETATQAEWRTQGSAGGAVFQAQVGSSTSGDVWLRLSFLVSFLLNVDAAGRAA